MIIKTILPSSARQFAKDYRLPLAATLAFIIIALSLFIGRLHERSALGQILAVKNSAGQDYAGLLSNDKADDFQKNDVSSEVNSDPASQTKPTTTGSSPTTAAAPTSGTSETVAVTPPTTSSGSGTLTPTPVGPFTAAITAFKQDQAATLQCPGGSVTNLTKCTKTYSFAATIQTANGPGTVKYNWKYSVNGSSNGEFTAVSGTNSTTLHNTITLNCKDAGTFSAQFLLTNPSAAQSQALQVTHSCLP
ncbi:MAG TPA: hypothetical protein VM124_01955 [Candidatus Limnocylindrales bacterium]|nr:hypothetical protein [Candidatus Limnocylindrales bacterium]